MTKLSHDQIKLVAKLANLKLEEKEIAKFVSQLSSVVSYIEELASVDTSNTPPTSQTTGLENALREDKVDPASTLNVSDVVSGAKRQHNGYFVVPMILERKNEK